MAYEADEFGDDDECIGMIELWVSFFMFCFNYSIITVSSLIQGK